MDTIAVDLDTLREQLGALLAVLALNDRGHIASGEAEQLLSAYGQLLEIMQQLDNPIASAAPTDSAVPVDELSNFAFDLLDETARQLSATDAYSEPLARLRLGFANWFAHHDAHIERLEGLIDSAALVANRTRDVDFLARLASVLLALTDAAAAHYKTDLDKQNPGRPWRILHINLGIVATRSRRADIMEQAFARLTAHLPQDAAQFFHQGMEQLQRVDYPESVRSVMTKYYDRWGNKPALH